ncbi:hypothetical protein [Streptomyces sp. NBC_00057]|uniref:hypothetical protein n=1 Tax=Streptomyces sp. NBC_00057 TaxID=2975634 RepID=UPI0032453DEE
MANWRDAALELGEFAPVGPALRLCPGGKDDCPVGGQALGFFCWAAQTRRTSWMRDGRATSSPP